MRGVPAWTEDEAGEDEDEEGEGDGEGEEPGWGGADGVLVGLFVEGGGERAYELGRARLGRGGIGWRGRRGRRGGGRVGLLVGSEMVRWLSVWVWSSKGVGGFRGGEGGLIPRSMLLRAG